MNIFLQKESSLHLHQEVIWRLVFAVALLCFTAEAQIRCKGKDGKDVDWYILYKLPRSLEYFYMDPDPSTEGMISNPISHQNGPLAKTLEPYFSKKQGSGYIAYSDQTPTCNAPDVCGHSKGFVMTDDQTGFWLLHSTPKFPNGRASNNFYPSSGDKNAQTFICVTFKADMFEHIGKHLQYIKAHVFEHDIPNTFHKTLQDAANGATADPNQLTVLHQDLKSEGGQTFRRFVKKQLQQITAAGKKRNQNNPCGKDDEYLKNAKGGDLYVFIADSIRSDVQVQHWGIQSGRCEDYKPNTGNKVLNVECVGIDRVEPWKPTKDHSKWCVSEDNNWTCFGDSNRSLSQFERRGGALCINDRRVTQKFKTFIKQKSDCPNNTKRPKTK